MWLTFALFEAFSVSLISSINKHQVKTIHPLTVLFLNQCFSVLLMFIVIIFLGGIPHLTLKFFILIFCSSILDVVAFISSYFAFKYTQISLLSPLSSLTPVVATLFGALFLHEIPTLIKLLGIITVVFGVYMLNASEIKGGFLKPFKTLFSNKGVKLYFIQVILFGITPIFQKQAIFQIHPSMPIFASFIGNTFVTIYLTVFALRKIKFDRLKLMENKWFFALFGILNTFGQLSAYMAFSKANVGYATAIFSLSSLFTVILGGVLFKESNINERLFGAIIMIAGTIFLAI